jgi:hypothetical protein
VKVKYFSQKLSRPVTQEISTGNDMRVGSFVSGIERKKLTTQGANGTCDRDNIRRNLHMQASLFFEIQTIGRKRTE